MGNICNIFSNQNLQDKYQKNLNISTPQFIPQGIPIVNNYIDLSNSQPIAIPTANPLPSNYNNNPIYVNSLSDYSSSYYSSSNYSLNNSYEKTQPTIFHHYNYNYNNNDNTNNLLYTGVLFSELEVIDDLCD